MKEQLVLLIELQKLESAAARIASRQREVPARIAALEAEFQKASDVVKGVETAWEDLKKRKLEQDSLLQKGQEAIRKSKERLAEVKTNKEYQSILKEIEASEHKNSQLEDEAIVLLDTLDAKEKEVQTAKETLKEQSRRYEAEKALLEGELQSLSGTLAERQREADATKTRLQPEILRKYGQVKAAGRGIAVVPVWKEVCEGCHMSIPPQLYNELQKSETLLTCPNCIRIIYWENRNSKTG
ncbi:MAG: C4-type zinc ribbon domain-containing protein [Syntrophaceae bacterium]|nr:C4-type zinc ribbon domain-containing protein [Syntrophaceae bacterium]